VVPAWHCHGAIIIVPRGPPPRSGRGSQYASRDYQSLPISCGIRQSMSARVNPYHNFWTESFRGALKTFSRLNQNPSKNPARLKMGERRRHRTLPVENPNQQVI
jgi:transposase InsO family protein